MTDGERARAAERRDLWRRQAAAEGGTLLFETAGESAAGQSYLFRGPVKMLTADDESSLGRLLADLTAALAEGFYIAGFVRYEAGYAFERVRNRSTRREPLAWFGVYREPEMAGVTPSGSAALLADPLCLSMETPLPQYLEQVAAVKQYIAEGDTYQVNLTTAMTASYGGAALPLYEALAAQQPAPFSALLHLPDDEFVLSFSPELFFSLDGDRVVTVRPMKGTAARQGSEEADQRQMAWLAADEKNRAEHLMIVDLLRSDLGRLCTAGSIRADRLFEVERYRTLLQMTSTITGSLGHGVTLADMFRALFPSGSMTGAPKPRTMEIIAELEGRTRGVYSGTIGLAAPDGTAAFNVAIRTVVLKDGRLRMGVGGGVVADSIAEQEHAECWLKSEFLLRAAPPFSLLETLLWDTGFWLLEAHLDRMESSAEQLNFTFNRAEVAERLLVFAGSLRSRQRVRVVMERSGEMILSATAAPAWRSRLTAWISPRRTWSKDSFLRHKTTFRPVYDDGTREAQRLGFDETLYANERDELTEGSLSTVLLLLEGRWRTPALTSGVLPGVARSRLLAQSVIEEVVVGLGDLERAQAMALCNGVRGVGLVGSVTMEDGRVLGFRTDVEVPELLD